MILADKATTIAGYYKRVLLVHIISTQLDSNHLIFIKLMHFRCLQLLHDMIHRLHLLYCITEETHFPILFTCSEGHLQQDTL